jgi:hypothetical protein
MLDWRMELRVGRGRLTWVRKHGFGLPTSTRLETTSHADRPFEAFEKGLDRPHHLRYSWIERGAKWLA